jgi:hypothetical protein
MSFILDKLHDLSSLPLDIKLGVFFAALIIFLWLRQLKKSNGLPLPPGIPGKRKLPLLGNLFDIPVDTPWVQYHEWSKEIGTRLWFVVCAHRRNLFPPKGSEILHLEAAGQHIIVLDNAEAANELLEKRSSLYSNRSFL